MVGIVAFAVPDIHILLGAPGRRRRSSTDAKVTQVNKLEEKAWPDQSLSRSSAGSRPRSATFLRNQRRRSPFGDWTGGDDQGELHRERSHRAGAMPEDTQLRRGGTERCEDAINLRQTACMLEVLDAVDPKAVEAKTMPLTADQPMSNGSTAPLGVDGLRRRERHGRLQEMVVLTRGGS